MCRYVCVNIEACLYMHVGTCGYLLVCVSIHGCVLVRVPMNVCLLIYTHVGTWVHTHMSACF